LAISVPLAIALALWLPDAARAQAQRPDRASEPVMVTGTRLPATLRQSTDSLTIITREQIDTLAAASGPDLLRQVPGLQVDQMGGPGGLSSVYIRGSDSNHVLVLIDGVRVNDPTNSRGGGFDISSLDPALVERIEVLRGAASAIYGADAMGGVINIVLRRDGAASARLVAAVGGFGYASGNARASLSLGSALMLDGAVSRLRDGRDADGGRIDLTQYSAKAHITVDPRSTIDLAVRRGERRSSAFPDDSGGVQLAVLRTLERKSSDDTVFSADGRWSLDPVSLVLGVSSFRKREDIDSPGVAPGQRSDFGVPSSQSHTDYRRDSGTASVAMRLAGASQLALGIELQNEHGVNDTVYEFFGTPIPVAFDLHRRTQSAFVETMVQASRDLILKAGLRHDHIEGSGSRTSPNLGLRYHWATIDGSLKASYSEGFKPPSFFALGLPIPLGGNPDLRPERNQGGSVGYEQFLGRGLGSAGVSLFKSKYTDLVTFDNNTGQTVNANQVDIHGAEFEVHLKPTTGWSLRAHFTRLFSHVVDSDEPLRQRPGRRGGVQFDWTVAPDLQVAWRTEYSALVFDSSVPTGNLTLPTYLRSDLNGSWRLRPGMSLTLAIDNVFDKRNVSYVGATALQRRGRVGLSLAL
jgi:vitamin B12 transporter